MSKEHSNSMDKFDGDWDQLSSSDFLNLWYERAYTATSYSGVSHFVQKAMHKSLEFKYSKDDFFASTLELGAGQGEHLQYVKHRFKSYIMSDIRVDRNSCRECSENPGVYWDKQDVESLTYPDESFDRVLNMCLLHHVRDPESSLMEVRRVLKVGGRADLFLSADPGALFLLARYLGPYSKSKKVGLGPQKRLADARDHLNHVNSLLRLTSHVFRKDEIHKTSYPFGIPFWNVALWFTFRITKR